MIFIGGYIVGMAMTFIAMLFLSGVKQANAAYDEQTRAMEVPRTAVRPTRARRKAKTLNTAIAGRATA